MDVSVRSRARPGPVPTVRATPPPRRGAALLSLCLLCALASGCSAPASEGHASPPAHPLVLTLLPDLSAGGRSWDWTASCPEVPSGPTGCTSQDPDLGSAQVNGDLWNLGTGGPTPGTLAMSVDAAGVLRVQGDFPSTPPCNGSRCPVATWVRGFPNVAYGVDQCSPGLSPPGSASFTLPIRLSAIRHDLIATTGYSPPPAGVTYDISYDMWLNRTRDTECQTNSTVEIMVWTDYSAGAPPPASLLVTSSATLPFAVNGVVNAGTDGWSMYVTGMDRTASNPLEGGTVWLVPNTPLLPDGGVIGIDLSSAFVDVADLLQSNYGWSTFAQTYWLDTVPFGMEFGPSSGASTDAGQSDFSLDLSSFCLGTGLTLAEAIC